VRWPGDPDVQHPVCHKWGYNSCRKRFSTSVCGCWTQLFGSKRIGNAQGGKARDPRPDWFVMNTQGALVSRLVQTGAALRPGPSAKADCGIGTGADRAHFTADVSGSAFSPRLSKLSRRRSILTRFAAPGSFTGLFAVDSARPGRRCQRPGHRFAGASGKLLGV